jgi:antitoxin (DNA-binding transcriptional repressor) of toxin-antitoxin stability system
MKIEISTTEAARNLGDCLARIKHTGDHFVLMKNNRPIAELGPVAGARRMTLGSLWEAMRNVGADDEFARDLEKVNDSDTVLDNPWR